MFVYLYLYYCMYTVTDCPGKWRSHRPWRC